VLYLSKTIFVYRFYKILVIETTTEVKAESIGAPSVKEIVRRTGVFDQCAFAKACKRWWYVETRVGHEYSVWIPYRGLVSKLPVKYRFVSYQYRLSINQFLIALAFVNYWVLCLLTKYNIRNICSTFSSSDSEYQFSINFVQIWYLI
jgi:hypothetical protein